MLRFLVLSLALMAAAPALAARVIDGDTLDDGAITWRIEGIDAPELGQVCGTPTTRQWDCGAEAKRFLERALAGRRLRCTALGKDGYGRTLGQCSADGQDIGALMVEAGQAWAFTKYSLTYVDVEKRAIFAQQGIWSAPSQPAWDYRAARWTVSAKAAPKGCPIKGNISKSGKIYHPPWSPWYAKTRIDTSKGERWFCSEDEAIAAGWRAPRW